MRIVRVLIVASLSTPLLASAQTAAIMEWPIAVGSHVRIESPVLGSGLQKGSVAASTADTLLFQPKAEVSPIPIATPNIVKLEVARGQHTHKARSALVGFLIGAGAGAVLGAATYKKPECHEIVCDILPDTRSFDATLGAVLLGGAGAIVGAVIGAHPTDTWVPVAVPRR
jgi:hypothetical protein